MAVYIVTGNLGSGKSLICMGRMRDYLWRNRRVATNVNVRLEHMVTGKFPRDVLRIPDHPSAEFLWDGLGYGSDQRDEKTFGFLLIDEVGTWLNAREWKGQDRQRVIEWFIHSRKRRWDCYLVAQSVNMIDKQVREAIGEHIVFCRRFDRMSVPFIGPIFAAIGLPIPIPQVHVAAVRYCAGMSVNTAPTVDRWFYRGRELWGSYDTSQRFDAKNDGVATMLSPDKYRWIRKPENMPFAIQWWLERGKHYKLAEAWHNVRQYLGKVTDHESDFRWLQLCDEYLSTIVQPYQLPFDQWHERTQLIPLQGATPRRVGGRQAGERGNPGYWSGFGVTMAQNAVKRVLALPEPVAL